MRSNAAGHPADPSLLLLNIYLKGNKAYDEADNDIIHAAQKLMMTLNKGACEAVLALRERFGRDSVHACTDVTGFGLLGHCVEMALGSDIEIVIDASHIDILPRVYEFANMGILPEGMYKNRDFAEKYASFEKLLEGKAPSPQRIGTVGEFCGGARVSIYLP